MERLYAPWRHAYVTRTAEPGACVFCDAPATADGRALIVHEGQTAYVILNLFPYTSGHLMVVPRRHVPTLAALQPEELGEIGSLTRGKRADLIMVNTRQVNIGVVTEPAHMLVEAAQPANVDTVIVDGKILKRGGELTAVDVGAILDEAAAASTAVRRRANWSWPAPA